MIITTYKCCGFNIIKSSYIKHLLQDSFVIFLQEIWLIYQHLFRLNDAFPDCNVFSRSGVENLSIAQGRPYGGCAIVIIEFIVITPFNYELHCLLLWFNCISF